MECEITVGGAAGVDELKPLWLQMLSHHRDLVGDEFPVHAGEESWERVRRDYGDWLASETAILLIARTPMSCELLGYVVCRLRRGGATFDLGAVRGDIDSLVVDDHARCRGIGTALLEGVRASLNERGVSYWSIGVLARNTEAAKLYQRVGFQPWTQELLASTRSS